MNRIQALRALVAVAVLGACNSENGDNQATASTSALSFSNTLDSAPAEASEALVLWSVSSSTPDYLYLWGRAALQGSTFSIDLRSRPPADAMNAHGLGVGLVLLAPRAAAFEDGRLSEEEAEDSLADFSGGAEQHAIIYVDHDQADAVIESRPEATPEEMEEARGHWLFDFPPGYSCGEGREAQPGETFDSFAPVDCRDLEVKLGDLEQFEFPNWT